VKKIINRKAKFKYSLEDYLETGVVLTGAEVKSIKSGRLSLGDAFVRVKDGELFLVNAQVSAYQTASEGYDPSRQRKLLARKSEIQHLAKKIETKGFTLVPTAAYTKRGNIKIEIALGKGKKEYEKRDIIKRRDQQREIDREMKNLQ